MKSTVETLSPTRVRLAVEVPFDELKPSFDAAYKKIGAQVQVPGFRPGKVPGRGPRPAASAAGVVLEEVVNDAVPQAHTARRSEQTSVTRRSAGPRSRSPTIEDGEPLAFTAEVDVRPGDRAARPGRARRSPSTTSRSTDERDRRAARPRLRERFATLTGVERAGRGRRLRQPRPRRDRRRRAGRQDGTADRAVARGRQQASCIDGLDEALVGLSAGEDAHLHRPSCVGGELRRPRRPTSP
ncbi:MAG: trigger factor family protein [Geodermatophilaceae bacterium]